MQSHYEVNIVRHDTYEGGDVTYQRHYFRCQADTLDKAQQLAADFRAAWPDALVQVTHWRCSGIPVNA